MKKVLAIMALALLIFACSFSVDLGNATPTSVPTATLDVAATETAVGAANAEATEVALDIKASEEALATVEALSQKTATAQAKQTERAISRMTSTAEGVLEMTAVAEPYLQELAYLYDNGYVSTLNGAYFPLEDFQQSWAQMNYFNLWPTGYAPSNFVVSTDIEWDSASDKANWFNSGCGFIFRADEDIDDFYIVYLALDGYVDFARWQNRTGVFRDRQYYGTLDVPKGQAHLTIAVDGDNINIFVNGKHVLRRVDSGFAHGYLAYTLSSGTNKGFGTRCTMTNGGLWDLDAVEETGEKSSFNW